MEHLEINMKLSLFIYFLVTSVVLSEAQDNAGSATNLVKAHGYFKCPAGTIEVIASTANFTVLNEESETYTLDVTFCYKPMTDEDVINVTNAGGMWGLPRERNRSLQVPGFPGPFVPVLHFTLGDWPIGHLPPQKGDKIKNLYFRASGRTLGAYTTDDHPEKWKVEWTIIPYGNEFNIKGHCVSSVTSTGCEWDITFEARTHGWAKAKHSLKRPERDQTNKVH